MKRDAVGIFVMAFLCACCFGWHYAIHANPLYQAGFLLCFAVYIFTGYVAWNRSSDTGMNQ